MNDHSKHQPRVMGLRNRPSSPLLDTPTLPSDFEQKTAGDDAKVLAALLQPTPPVVPVVETPKPKRTKGRTTVQCTLTVKKEMNAEFQDMINDMMKSGILVRNSTLFINYAMTRLINDYNADKENICKDFREFFIKY